MLKNSILKLQTIRTLKVNYSVLIKNMLSWDENIIVDRYSENIIGVFLYRNGDVIFETSWMDFLLLHTIMMDSFL